MSASAAPISVRLPRVTRFLLVLATALVFVTSSLWLSSSDARADVNDFSYDSWSVDYRIGVDDSGRAQARVTETLTAVFPDTDNNRGIVRALPDQYQGTDVHLRDFEVLDGAGNQIPFEIEEDDGFTMILTGDDRYVHGRTTYVLSYTMSDVILVRDDGTADEFYWDLLDFEHLQPVDRFSARITFEEPLASELTGNGVCYAGLAQSTDLCALSQSPEDPATWVLEPQPAAAKHGVSVAIGLAPGAVVQPPARLPNFQLDFGPLIAAGVALIPAASSFVIARALKRRRRTARGVIVAQYDVPTDLPPLLAAPVVGASKPAAPAEIVHLAVAGAIRIEAPAEASKKSGMFAKQPQPVLRYLDQAAAVDPLDQLALRRIFGSTQPGSAFTVPKEDSAFAKNMETLQADGKKAAEDRGYFARAHSVAGRWIGIAGILVSSAAIAFGIAALVMRGSPLPLLAIVAGGVALILSALGTGPQRVHTQLGAETREHLLGVREFIRVAEADRIQMLQSYTGAERLASGDVNVIHLYERLLPYAMLFGLEKQWTGVLETSYADQTDYAPGWITGAGIAGISNISSTISSFTSSLSSSVSYTSSSSGGSTGGGFAGGGGGGGFSGGR